MQFVILTVLLAVQAVVLVDVTNVMLVMDYQWTRNARVSFFL